MISNKGFFVPTIMFFISIFLIFILIITLDSFTYSSTNKMYLEEAKEETAIIKSNFYIKDTMQKDYEEACNQEKFTIKDQNYNLEIETICFFDINTMYTKAIKELIGTNKLEYNDLEYEGELKKLSYLEKEQKILTSNLISKILDFLKGKIEKLPEAKLIIKVIEKELDNKLKEYVAFDVSYENKKRRNNFLYYYNFKDSKKMKVIHT